MRSQRSTAFPSLRSSSMSPLTRQETLPSIHSWWSDSNSALVYGPTINLHAAAKPLMRRMYHRQALALIRKNRGKPLSGTMLETYTSYFQWDFVLWSTKAAIFEDLADRVKSKVDEALAVVDSPDFSYITQMLNSPDIGARISSCELLAGLAMHKCTTEAILALRTCAQLVPMLQDENLLVTEQAAHALAMIARSLDGAQAIVDAGPLGHVSELLESPSSTIRKWTCMLVGNLVCHESTRAAVLVLKPYHFLVSLLSNGDSQVIEFAVKALKNIAQTLDGAQAIVDAGAFGYVSTLLESPSSTIRKWTCILVGNLANHRSTPPASTVLALKPYESLVSLLSDEDSEVVEWAVYALWRIARSLKGAQVVVNSGALVFVSELFRSPGPNIRKWTCELVGNLAWHSSTRAAVLALDPFESLVTLLSDKDFQVVACAAHALSQSARSLDGAQAIVDARGLDYVSTFLASPSPGIRKWTCALAGNLASHKPTRAAVLRLKPYKQLVALLRDKDYGVVEEAEHALSLIACSSDGAQAIVNARGLDHVSTFLESPSPEIRKWTCTLAGNLASHKPTRVAVLRLKPYKQLVALLRDKVYGIVEEAAHVLSLIACSLDGAQAIVDAGVLGHASELLESPSSTIRKWTCMLVGNLARHHSTRAAVLALKPYESLVSLLSDKNSEVVDAAAHALSLIACSSDGAQAIVDAGALDHASELLGSPSSAVRKCTCMLVGNLACHHSTRAAVLELKPYESLVSLLSDKTSEVVNAATHALSQIARSLDGAQAIVDAGALGHISELLESPSSTTRKWTCLVVGNLASHKSTTTAVLALKPYKSLVSLLSNQDSKVVKWAVRALWRIARSLEGAQAVVNTGALVLVLELFQSPSPNIRKWTCELIGKLASHELTLPAILELEPSEQLVSCLLDPLTRASAIFALHAISEWPDGVAALADLNAVWELQELN